MSLPNYTPEGTIHLGAVPWDNTYTNVRLYANTTEQYNDIYQQMGVHSSDFVYLGRNRRIKLDLPADTLYHCNYCMYQNKSVCNGWIYCFITDVEYINDNTTEISIETDVFQTYLYGLDWTIPPCFIERETVPSEDSKYLLTAEPEMNLLYKITDTNEMDFSNVGGYAICTSARTETKYVETPLNNYQETIDVYAADSAVTRGTFRGANFYYVNDFEGWTQIGNILKNLNKAGTIESVVSVFTIPVQFYPGDFKGWNTANSTPRQPGEYQASFDVPERGNTVDGYKPKNAKLLYYPYTYCRVTDYNGSCAEYRYELMDSRKICCYYEPDPTCQALVAPHKYMNTLYNLDYGFVTNCGSTGTWSNTAFQNWLAQNAGSIVAGAFDIALTGLSFAIPAAGAIKSLKAAETAAKIASTSKKAKQISQATKMYERATDQALKTAGVGAGIASSQVSQGANLAAQIYNASKQPTVQRGTANYDMLFMTGMQGLHAQRFQVRAEFAEQIDEFFTTYGYSVERIEDVNITSRPAFNYVKTVGASAKSLYTRSVSEDYGSILKGKVTRGAGTPADALAVINAAFDGGVTFWHTTSNFGDYGLDNSL